MTLDTSAMRASKSALRAALGLSWASQLHAQQFASAKQAYDAMGLSAACTAVLDTEMEHCDAMLFHRTDRSTGSIVEVLPRSELDVICEPKCREELATLREKIVSTCTAPEDVMQESNLEFPPVVFADKFAYTYDLVCKKHKTTGRFCDEVWAEWREGKAKFDSCDDCYLGQMVIQLASPIGVSSELAELFNKTVSDCKDAAKYPFKATKSYVRLSDTEDEEQPMSCDRSYTVKKGDTCNSIAASQEASTLDVVQLNGIDINCVLMPEEGTKLCLNRRCDTYTIRAGDGCSEIAKKFDITEYQFRLLNPMLDSNCTNIGRWEGYVSCVGPKSLLPQSALVRRRAAVTPQKPLAPGSSEKCLEFANGRAVTDPDLVEMAERYPTVTDVVSMEDSNRCHLVAAYNGISVAELHRLNPSLAGGTKCVLDENNSYCVHEEGSVLPERSESWDRRWAQRWG